MTLRSVFIAKDLKTTKSSRTLLESHIPSPIFTTAQLGFDITNAQSLLCGAKTWSPGDFVNSSVRDPRSVCGVCGLPVSEAGWGM